MNGFIVSKISNDSILIRNSAGFSHIIPSYVKVNDLDYLLEKCLRCKFSTKDIANLLISLVIFLNKADYGLFDHAEDMRCYLTKRKFRKFENSHSKLDTSTYVDEFEKMYSLYVLIS